MCKWEYDVVEPPGSEAFADMGRDGWELVCITDGVAYFKRPLPDYESTESEDEA
jgi:hypothetical protein